MKWISSDTARDWSNASSQADADALRYGDSSPVAQASAATAQDAAMQVHAEGVRDEQSWGVEREHESAIDIRLGGETWGS